MASPFPGMDPYLEDSEFWADFHSKLASEIAYQLTSLISPKYFTGVEIHNAGISELNLGKSLHNTYPDVGIYQPLGHSGGTLAPVAVMTMTAPLERMVMLPERTKTRTIKIYITKTSQLVTAIELLSPANKRGLGLEEYQRKRMQLLDSPVHLMELDLLRGGERPGPEVYSPPIDTDYILLVNRVRPGLRVSEIWPLPLNEAFPVLPVPLLPPDPDVPLDLNQALQTVYDRSGYHWRIDYSQPPPAPALRPVIAEWRQENKK